jgi:hypothetical protein
MPSQNMIDILNRYRDQNNQMMTGLDSVLKKPSPNLSSYQNPNPINLTPSDLSGTTPSEPKSNWFLDTLNFLDRPRAAIVNPLADIAQNGWSNAHVMQDIWDGISKNEGHKSFSDILNAQTAVKDTPGKLDWNDVLGFVGDVALDPLTYLTFGAGSVAKAGTKAALQAAKGIAEKEGMQLGRMGKDVFSSFPEQVYDNTISKYASNPNINQNLAERLATKKYYSAEDAINNAAKEARATSQNSLLNLDVPFTNITKGLISKEQLPFGMGSPFIKSSPAIGTVGAEATRKLLTDAGLGDAEHADFLKNIYGTSDASQLTLQQLDHLKQNLPQFDPAIVRNLPNDYAVKEYLQKYLVPDVRYDIKTQKPIINQELNYTKFQPEDILNNIDPRIAKTVEPLIQGFADDISGLNKLAPQSVEMYGDFIKQLTSTIKGKTADEVRTSLSQVADTLRQAQNTAKISYRPFQQFEEWIREATKLDKPAKSIANDLEKQFGKFVADAGGKSSLGAKLSKNILNPRTLLSKDELVNDAAVKIRNTDNRVYGHIQQMNMDMKNLSKITKGLTSEEKNAVYHVLENKAPGGKSIDDYLNGKNKDKILEAAQHVKNILDRIGQRDIKSGTVGKLRQNYFPHVFGMADDEARKILERLQNDPELKKFLGRSQTNKHGMERTGFQTLADWQDAITGLMKEGKTEEANALRQLFEGDMSKALERRYYTSIRSSAMADLYKDLRGSGLIQRSEDRISFPNSHGEMKTLDAQEAKKLGLPVGTAVHQEVYQGLQKMHDLFTDKGVQNVLDQLNGIQNIWKSLVTSVMPSHHFFNFIGNVANNAMAGVTVKRYKDAGILLKKLEKGTLNDKEQKLVQQALDQGVLNQGHVSDYAGNMMNFRKPTWGDKVADGIRNLPGAKQMQDVGNMADNFTRLALFLEGKAKTGSAQQAGDMVHKYLFNYREITNADKVMRLGIPFWTWTKNNIPLQLEHLMQSPRYYATYGKIKERLAGDPNATPDWAQEEYMKTGIKNDQGQDYMMNPRLPLQDLSKLGDPMHMMLNSMTPFAKVPIEVDMNKQFFNGQPIDRTKATEDMSYDPNALIPYLERQLGGLSKLPGLASGEVDPLSLLIGKPQAFDPEKTQLVKRLDEGKKKKAEQKRAKEGAK